jgi:hypothetical protein
MQPDWDGISVLAEISDTRPIFVIPAGNLTALALVVYEIPCGNE